MARPFRRGVALAGLALAGLALADSRRPLDVDGRLQASRRGRMSSDVAARGGSCILARVDAGRLDGLAFGAFNLCKKRVGMFGATRGLL